MTLLAVREFFDIPVLIADTLVSSKASRKHRRIPRFPTQPPNTILYPKSSVIRNFLPSNTYRKIYIISDNFAVGCAGDWQLPSDLLRRIWFAFAGRVVTLDAWEKFITSEHPDPASDMVLAGWIIESERRVAFRWKSKFPTTLEKDTSKGASFSDGTGEDFAQRTFGEPEQYTTTASEGRDKATFCALDEISELIAYELLEGRNLRQLFGLCYEAIVHDGNKFSYIDDVNYLHYRYIWAADKPDQIDGGIVRFRIHYKNFGDYACCTVQNHAYDPHVNASFVIKPIFGEKSQADWMPAKHLYQGFESEYFCNFFIVLASDGKNMYSPVILPKGSPRLQIEFTNEGAETYVKMKEGHRDFILQHYLRYRAQLG